MALKFLLVFLFTFLEWECMCACMTPRRRRWEESTSALFSYSISFAFSVSSYLTMRNESLCFLPRRSLFYPSISRPSHCPVSWLSSPSTFLITVSCHQPTRDSRRSVIAVYLASSTKTPFLSRVLPLLSLLKLTIRYLMPSLSSLEKYREDLFCK